MVDSEGLLRATRLNMAWSGSPTLLTVATMIVSAFPTIWIDNDLALPRPDVNTQTCFNSSNLFPHTHRPSNSIGFIVLNYGPSSPLSLGAPQHPGLPVRRIGCVGSIRASGRESSGYVHLLLLRIRGHDDHRRFYPFAQRLCPSQSGSVGAWPLEPPWSQWGSRSGF